MAIARKPHRTSATAPSEDPASKFIAGAGQAEPAIEPAIEETTRRVPAMIRFDARLLERIDAAAKRSGISRSAWVQYTLSQVLDTRGSG